MRTSIIVVVAAMGGLLASGADPSSPRDADTGEEQGRPDPDALVEVTMRVPVADLGIWDPINPNVNPLPWRVLGPEGADGPRSAVFRHQAIGDRVRVEGIAWGYDVETDAPRSRVLFEGGTVLIKRADFNQPAVHGKLVRVEGTLRREFFKGHPGYARQFPEYYFIDVSAFEVIDAVTTPKVVRLEPRG